MKKILLFATLVACSLMFFSCEKKPTIDPNQDAIARVKSEVIGSSWKGNLVTLLGEKVKRLLLRSPIPRFLRSSRKKPLLQTSSHGSALTARKYG